MKSNGVFIEFFRMHFNKNLQYRVAALAGVITQFAWGVLEITAYAALHNSNSVSFPMEFQAFVSYIWMQQAFLALFMPWYCEIEIYDSVSSGAIAYELCKPVHIYEMWFARSMAYRLARATMRFAPVLLGACILPEPYRLHFPSSPWVLSQFIVSMMLAFLLVVTLSLIIYSLSFYTISTLGIRIVSSSLIELLSGAVIPLPFLPKKLQWFLEWLPFGAAQNIPFRIYSADLNGGEVYEKMLIQLIWIVILIMIGRILIKQGLKKMVIQGG